MQEYYTTKPPLPTIPGVEIRLVPWMDGYALGSDGSFWCCKKIGKYVGDAIYGEWFLKSQTPDRAGYFQVGAMFNGMRKTLYVHRLMARVFLGEPPQPDYQACHNDGNNQNNSISNIRWDTRKNNEADKELHGTRMKGSNHSMAKLTDEQVRCIRSSYKKHSRRFGHNGLAKQFGVCRQTIESICYGQTWKHLV